MQRECVHVHNRNLPFASVSRGYLIQRFRYFPITGNEKRTIFFFLGGILLVSIYFFIRRYARHESGHTLALWMSSFCWPDGDGGERLLAVRSGLWLVSMEPFGHCTFGFASHSLLATTSHLGRVFFLYFSYHSAPLRNLFLNRAPCFLASADTTTSISHEKKCEATLSWLDMD
ncbi:hypothetical protein BGX38DRAFT_1148225 [Terfezia claveryi]|nr:hypothetical protein BGX38DRAFT_1148225 [Terfezia claveryi]